MLTKCEINHLRPIRIYLKRDLCLEKFTIHKQLKSASRVVNLRFNKQVLTIMFARSDYLYVKCIYFSFFLPCSKNKQL